MAKVKQSFKGGKAGGKGKKQVTNKKVSRVASVTPSPSPVSTRGSPKKRGGLATPVKISSKVSKKKTPIKASIKTTAAVEDVKQKISTTSKKASSGKTVKEESIFTQISGFVSSHFGL